MSEEELVDAYTNGMISRRTFVRRLVAGGVSLAAAITYADVLNPTSAIASTPKSPVAGDKDKHDKEPDHDKDDRHHHHHKGIA